MNIKITVLFVMTIMTCLISLSESKRSFCGILCSFPCAFSGQASLESSGEEFSYAVNGHEAVFKLNPEKTHYWVFDFNAHEVREIHAGKSCKITALEDRAQNMPVVPMYAENILEDNYNDGTRTLQFQNTFNYGEYSSLTVSKPFISDYCFPMHGAFIELTPGKPIADTFSEESEDIALMNKFWYDQKDMDLC